MGIREFLKKDLMTTIPKTTFVIQVGLLLLLLWLKPVEPGCCGRLSNVGCSALRF